MMNSKSQIQIIREKHQGIQDGICNLLDIGAVKYLDFQMDEGFLYLRQDLRLDRWSVDQLTASRIFWSWWRQQWFQLDATFIRRFPVRKHRSITQANRIKSYYFNEFHSKANIQCHLEVLKQTYKEMLNRIITKTNRHAERKIRQRNQPQSKRSRRTQTANKQA